jgi:hypothetical protein
MPSFPGYSIIRIIPIDSLTNGASVVWLLLQFYYRPGLGRKLVLTSVTGSPRLSPSGRFQAAWSNLRPSRSIWPSTEPVDQVVSSAASTAALSLPMRAAKPLSGVPTAAASHAFNIPVASFRTRPAKARASLWTSARSIASGGAGCPTLHRRAATCKAQSGELLPRLCGITRAVGQRHSRWWRYDTRIPVFDDGRSQVRRLRSSDHRRLALNFAGPASSMLRRLGARRRTRAAVLVCLHRGDGAFCG